MVIKEIKNESDLVLTLNIESNAVKTRKRCLGFIKICYPVGIEALTSIFSKFEDEEILIEPIDLNENVFVVIREVDEGLVSVIKDLYNTSDKTRDFCFKLIEDKYIGNFFVAP